MRMRLKNLLNIHKDLAWQIVNQCLQTRAFLYKRNCTRSPRCPRPRCGDDETTKHLFWNLSICKKRMAVNVGMSPFNIRKGDLWFVKRRMGTR